MQIKRAVIHGIVRVGTGCDALNRIDDCLGHLVGEVVIELGLEGG